MEILENMEGQWGAFLPPSYHSNTTPVCRESQRNGKSGKKGKYAFKVASGFEEKQINHKHLNIRIGGNHAKKNRNQRLTGHLPTFNTIAWDLRS